MLIKRSPGWTIPEHQVTPEHVFLNRRSFMGAAAGAMALAAARPARAAEDPSAALYPAKANPAYTDAQRPLTDERHATTFNNYYEFGSSKRIAAAAEKLPIRPWEVVLDGEVEKPMTLGIDELLKQVTLEERIYRHRCVEAWSMVVPWTGFTVKSLVAIAKPRRRRSSCASRPSTCRMWRRARKKASSPAIPGLMLRASPWRRR